jgi:hypothetical protein
VFKSGVLASLRRLFAFLSLNERYRDITPIETPIARQ